MYTPIYRNDKDKKNQLIHNNKCEKYLLWPVGQFTMLALYSMYKYS